MSVVVLSFSVLTRNSINVGFGVLSFTELYLSLILYFPSEYLKNSNVLITFFMVAKSTEKVTSLKINELLHLGYEKRFLIA